MQFIIKAYDGENMLEKTDGGQAAPSGRNEEARETDYMKSYVRLAITHNG